MDPIAKGDYLSGSENNKTSEESHFVEEKCCEIYITTKRLMVFNCTICSAWQSSFLNFVKHILEYHYKEMDANEYTQIPQPNNFNSYSYDSHCDQELPDDGPSVAVLEDDSTDADVIQSECEISSHAHDSNNCEDEAMNIEGLSICASEDTQQQQQDAECVSVEENRIKFDGIVENSLNAKDLEKISQIAAGIYACDKCDRVYENFKNLQIHCRLHESTDRKYKCEQCGFAFKDNGNLRHHIRRHHSNEKRYACPECPKKFYGRSEMQSHLRCHTGERPYVCQTCGKTFRTLSTLNKHCVTHTGQKPHVCKLCGKSYSEASRLKEHISVHTGDRNQVCSVCGAKFVRVKTLRAHMKLHENKKEYVCSICSIGFNQRPALISHMKTRHKIVQAAKD